MQNVADIDHIDMTQSSYNNSNITCYEQFLRTYGAVEIVVYHNRKIQCNIWQLFSVLYNVYACTLTANLSMQLSQCFKDVL